MINRLKELLQGATKGPWEISTHKPNDFDCSVVSPSGDAELGTWLVAATRWHVNASLIAEGINALPSLIRAVEEAREALKLADASFSGANMNMNVVERKITDALSTIQKLLKEDGNGA